MWVVLWQEVLLRNTELISHQQPERSKGDPTCPTTSQNPSLCLGWLNKACTTRKDSESEWLATDNPETNPIHKTQDCKPCDRAVLLGSLTLLLSTWVPFPNKISGFVRRCVSSDNSFPSIRQQPGFGPRKGSSFLQHCLGFPRQEYWSGLPFPSPEFEVEMWMKCRPRDADHKGATWRRGKDDPGAVSVLSPSCGAWDNPSPFPHEESTPTPPRAPASLECSNLSLQSAKRSWMGSQKSSWPSPGLR